MSIEYHEHCGHVGVAVGYVSARKIPFRGFFVRYKPDSVFPVKYKSKAFVCAKRISLG
jgi:hypothetical protein